jgi:transcriptional regulator with XRE-family HTH domain
MTGKPVDKRFSAEVGKIIKEIREENGISRKELSEYIGISDYQLAKYEKGLDRISIERLFNISKYFKKSLDFFIKEERKDDEKYVNLLAIESVITGIWCGIKKYIADEIKNEGEDYSEEKIRHHPLFVLMNELKNITDLFWKLLEIKRYSYAALVRNNFCLLGIKWELENYICSEIKSRQEEYTEENVKRHPLFTQVTKPDVITDSIGRYVKKYKKEDEEEDGL